MEEIGYRATVFSFDGITGSQREYIQWLIQECVQPETEISEILESEAIELLAIPSDLDGHTDDTPLIAHLQAHGIRAGLKVHLRGRLWERSGQPTALAFDAGRSTHSASDRGAQPVNIWL